MIVISKPLFYEKIHPNVHCNVIHTWDPNCSTAFFSKYLTLNLLKGSAKFFLPIYMIRLLLTYKGTDKKTLLLNFLLSEVRSSVYGLVMGALIFISICFLRKLFGRIYYHNLLLVPGFVSGLSLLVESRENQILDTIIFFNSFIETILRKSGINQLWKTIMFTGVSGLLMHLMANRKHKIDFIYFWFYTPPMMDSKNKSDGTCDHKKTCPVYFSEGLFKYFLLGYAINIIKSLIPRIGSLVRNPSKNMGIFFSKSNVYFGLFMGSYVGLYRVLTCYLTRTSKIKKKFYGFIAGLFSGLTYAISPNIQVLVLAITTILQIVYDYISRHMNITNHFWINHLLFIFCQGFLLQEKFYYPKTCSPYYSKMIDACTNNMTKELYDTIISIFFS